MLLKTIIPNLSDTMDMTISKKPTCSIEKVVASKNDVLLVLNESIQSTLLLEPSDDTINFELDNTQVIPLFDNGVVTDYKLKY